MNKKLVTPFITWLMFMVIGITSLINGIELNQTWRIMAAGAGLSIAIGFLVVILMNNNRKQLQPVRVKSRN